MQRLTPEMHDLLRDLREGKSWICSDLPGYIEGTSRPGLKTMPWESARRLLFRLIELDRLGMVILGYERVDVVLLAPVGGEPEPVLHVPRELCVTSLGRRYESERRKDAALHVVQAVAAAGLGLFSLDQIRALVAHVLDLVAVWVW